MQRLLLSLFAAVALLTAACGSDDDSAAPPTSDTGPGSTSPTSAGETDPDGPAWSRCESPEGLSVSFPSDWSTNDGSVTEACSLFDPDPFDVPDSTDARVAAISAYVDEVDFAVVAAPGRESDRAVTAVDGHQAVRLVVSGSELHGAGVESTRYVIDLSVGTEDGQGTLFVDTIELPGFDYETNVDVLDRMVRSIDLAGAEESSAGVVARYGGGGTPFAVGAELDRDGPCIEAPLDGTSTTECFSVPGPSALRFADLGGDLLDVVAGVAGDHVFRVDADTGASVSSYLPVAIADGDTRAWALPVGGGEVERITWSDHDGRVLGSRTLDDESGVDPVASFEAPPFSTSDFPASGDPSLLRDVRVAAHEGFDRIVFELDGASELSYEISIVDEVRATSGEAVEVDGDRVLRVTMTPVAGVDLSGSEPRQTYDGPERIEVPRTAAVTDLVQVEDFESTLTWAIGTDGEHDLGVAVLEAPMRLVIDVESTPSRS